VRVDAGTDAKPAEQSEDAKNERGCRALAQCRVGGPRWPLRAGRTWLTWLTWPGVAGPVPVGYGGRRGALWYPRRQARCLRWWGLPAPRSRSLIPAGRRGWPLAIGLFREVQAGQPGQVAGGLLFGAFRRRRAGQGAGRLLRGVRLPGQAYSAMLGRLVRWLLRGAQRRRRTLVCGQGVGPL
jgi:hypothetical protein